MKAVACEMVREHPRREPETESAFVARSHCDGRLVQRACTLRQDRAQWPRQHREGLEGRQAAEQDRGLRRLPPQQDEHTVEIAGIAARLDAADRIVDARRDEVDVRRGHGRGNVVQDRSRRGTVDAVHAPLHLALPALLQLPRITRGHRLLQVADARARDAGVTDADDAQRGRQAAAKPAGTAGGRGQARGFLHEPEALQHGDRGQQACVHAASRIATTRNADAGRPVVLRRAAPYPRVGRR